MFKNTKTIVTVLAAMVFFMSTGAAVAAWALFGKPFTADTIHYIYIDADDTIDSVRTKVVEAGGASQTLGFSLMSLAKGYTQPRTGRYAVESTDTYFGLVRRLANGTQTPVRLTVPEVRTVEAMAQRLSQVLMVAEDEILALLTDAGYLQALGGYTVETAPCLFIPDTYEVYWNISAEKLLERMHKEKETFWAKTVSIGSATMTRAEAAKAIGYTPEQVVTLASIVDSETSYKPEKPTIAGLYIHRLNVGMPLQSDPTVIFALHDFSIRRVTLAQTRYDSPYNTYKYQGLPPGPIRIPSVSGIDAVLAYDHNSYLYMCAKEDFSGSHNFTSDYNQHMQNARKYQKALNERGIRK